MTKSGSRKNRISSFDLEKGTILASKYIVLGCLGSGYEGEVYQIREMHTDITKAIKLFYPHRNKGFKISTRYIRKLDKLKEASLVMDYHSMETIFIDGIEIAGLVSEFIQGELLSELVRKSRGGRLGTFQALHLFYALVKGMEEVHKTGEYHGDLHLENVIIKRFGLALDLKVIDFHHWGDSKKANREEDLIKLIHIFYEMLGGPKFYKKLPPPIKFIIKGLKRNLILKEFKNLTALRVHLERLEWGYEH